MEKSKSILKKFWGFDEFRPLQEDIADASIYGHDILALLPTGGGKSVCFQVPGLAREGICIVISPLIALMNDQVNQLQKKGIRAKAIMSGMSYREIDITLDNARFNGLDFLYVSPERLKTSLFIERFKLMNVSLIVVDEAHCISEWGHDFRPPYLDIKVLRDYHPEVPFIALTATATEHVKSDIIKQLELKKPQIFEASFSRNNLSYEVYEVENKLKSISALVKRYANLSGIIYCQKRKSVKELAKILLAQGYKVGIYHGGMEAEDRRKMMNAWIKNELHVMVATNAFGMGIDKPDVRFVAHYEFPTNLEAYFQEAGRAGRDGLASRSFVFYEERDLELTEELVERQFPPLETIKRTYKALCNYLKIAVGSAENESYPIDLTHFISQFNLEFIATYQSLKLLELNGDLLFNEGFYHPTKLKFAVGNTVLYGFQIKYERVSNLIQLLSRSYPGIFEDFQNIHSKDFCKRLNVTKKELDQQLRFLEEHGIIDINWSTNLPLVTFLHERLPDDYLSLNAEVYHDRKIKAFDRWKAMKSFIVKDVCRSQFIIRYFGQESEACGTCDYCRSQLEKLSILDISRLIVNELKKQESIPFDNFQTHFENIPSIRFKEAFQQLILEEIIQVKNGICFLRTN